MSFFCLFLYILLSVIAPSEIVAALSPLRLTFWAGTLGLVFSAIGLFWKGTRFLRLPQFWGLMGFVFILCVSSTLNEWWLGAPGKVLSGFGVSLTMFLLVICNVDSMKRLRWTAIAIVVSAVALSAQGLISCVTGWDAWRVQLIYADASKGQERLEHSSEYQLVAADLMSKGDIQALVNFTLVARAAAAANGSLATRVRGNGIMQDPNDLALGLVTAMPFCWMAWKKRSYLRNLLCVWIPTGLMLTTMYYTRSRGGVVALLAVVGLLLSRRWGKTKTVFVVGALGAAMFALQFTGGRGVGGGDDSSEGRIDAWAEGFHMLGTHPALGVGYNGFRDYNALTAHNSYVLCFSETGVAGYFFWTSLIVATLLQLAGLLKIPREDQIGESVRRWAGTLQLSLCGFLVAGFFLSRTYVYIMYTLVAMVCGLTLIAQRERIEMVFPSLKKIVKVTMLIEAVSLVAIYFIVRVDPLLHGG